MKIESYLEYEAILANQAQPVHFAVKFEAEQNAKPRARTAGFCIVLDRSGSMEGAPLLQAKEAAKIAVRNLRLDDEFALVVFEEQARTIIPMQKTEADREDWLKAIDDIQTGGSTNLTAGWMLGRDELQKCGEQRSRRLMLLSDGQLNAGVVEPAIVRQITGSGLEKDSIRTSCLGFGNDYNEDLMAALAGSSGGQFYDAVSPESLPKIFEAELEGLQKLQVQNLRMRVRRRDFCESAGLLGNYPTVELPEGGTEIAIGDLVSGETRIICFRLEVLPLPLIENRPAFSLESEELLEVEFLFDELGETEITSKKIKQLIRIQAVQNPEDVRIQEEVIPWVAMQRAGRAISDATSEMDKGNIEEAARILKVSAQELREYGVPAKIEEAIKLLNELQSIIEARKWNVRERKNMRYASTSFLKMSSEEMWTGLAEEPSFKRKRRKPDADKTEPPGNLPTL